MAHDLQGEGGLAGPGKAGDDQPRAAFGHACGVEEQGAAFEAVLDEAVVDEVDDLVVVVDARAHGVVVAVAEEEDQPREQLFDHAAVGQVAVGFLELGLAGFALLDGEGQFEIRRAGLDGRDRDEGRAAAANEVAVIVGELFDEPLGVGGNDHGHVAEGDVQAVGDGRIGEDGGHEPGDGGSALHQMFSST